MSATLNTASALGAYLLSDRATWLAFRNTGNLRVLAEGDPRLRNPHVKAELARTFVEWLVSARGQSAIATFQFDGRQAFFPNAGTDS